MFLKSSFRKIRWIFTCYFFYCIFEKFYIFKLDNIIPSKAQSLSEAQESIHEFILNKKMQEKMVKWIAELKKNSYLKILQN